MRIDPFGHVTGPTDCLVTRQEATSATEHQHLQHAKSSIMF